MSVFLIASLLRCLAFPYRLCLADQIGLLFGVDSHRAIERVTFFAVLQFSRPQQKGSSPIPHPSFPVIVSRATQVNGQISAFTDAQLTPMANGVVSRRTKPWWWQWREMNSKRVEKEMR
jgi:hypothetical protein